MERGHDMTKSQKGTLCVFAAALLYSIGGLCIKLIPWGGMAINGSRTAIALVVIGAYLIWVKHPLRLNRWVALGALSVFGCNALFSIGLVLFLFIMLINVFLNVCIKRKKEA